MAEKLAHLPSDVDIAYETFGDPAEDPLLLVMGLGGPMTWWAPELCERLVDRGFFVIRFDNRDVGRSSRVPGPAPLSKKTLLRAYLGDSRYATYTLDEMAGDAFGLLDELGIQSAHVTGTSMGGMIAQTMAIARPDRVTSLVSVMSTTGRRRVGWADPRLFPMLLSPVARTQQAYVERALRGWRAISSSVYPMPDEDITARAIETWQRGYDPVGGARQTLAILAQPDRSAELERLRMPVAVVHGLADKLVHPSGGRATAAAVPGAELVLVPGMAHDIPPPLYDLFVDVLRRTADRAHPPLGADSPDQPFASSAGSAAASSDSVTSSSAR
ncbi:alpha/beta hydrolase [soil metagenome]